MTARPTDASTFTVFPGLTVTVTSFDSVMVSSLVIEEVCSAPSVRLNPADTSATFGIPAVTVRLKVVSNLLVVLQVVDLVTDLLYVNLSSSSAVVPFLYSSDFIYSLFTYIPHTQTQKNTKNMDIVQEAHKIILNNQYRKYKLIYFV